MNRAMYAFSGDPITYGHIDIIERASKAFDKLIVGIGVNPEKERKNLYMFSLEERTEMAKKATSKYSNVEVISFEGLLVDYAYENGIDTIVKGVRNSADFDYEAVLHEVGVRQKLGIDTHILFARPELAHVSSSVVKDVQKEQGLIHELVPLYVKQSIETRMSGQYIVGITGEPGTGKSYVSNAFVDLGKLNGVDVHNIDLDVIGHKILGELKHPRYMAIRQKIADTFGSQARKADGTIDRKILGERVFNDEGALQKLNDIMSTPLLLRTRRELYGKKGLILINAALIAEANLSYLSNNNVILVDADDETQYKRMKARNLTDDQIQRRLESQYDVSEKRSKLQQNIVAENHGTIWSLDNSEGNDEIESVFKQVLTELNVK
ncbi:pantetheine-phosphate adenylyltransferase [Candidatus Woesearchaeota archaeon]|nr:pantetheine-phosphate adenylyltransferase [Candidatus Woesearchaeota archaeon]